MTIESETEERAKAAVEVFRDKLVKRQISLKAFEADEPALSGKAYKVSGKILQGIESDKAKEISKVIRDEKLKGVQAQIQGDQLRVSGKKKDDLQAVIALLKGRTSGSRCSSSTTGSAPGLSGGKRHVRARVRSTFNPWRRLALRPGSLQATPGRAADGRSATARARPGAPATVPWRRRMLRATARTRRSARTRHRFRDRGRCGQAVILVQASKHGACCRLLHPQPEEGQLTMDLSGTWRLESAYFVAQKTGDRVDLLGAEPFGFLTLEPSGRSALARRRPAIPRHSSTRRFPRPLLVDGETAVAQVDGAWDPSWVGTEQVRFFTIGGRKPSLRSAPLQHPSFPDDEVVAYTTWDREA